MNKSVKENGRFVRNYPNWPFLLFLALEGALYVWFLASDFSGRALIIPSSAIKYASIWGCFLMAVYLNISSQGNGFMLLAQTLILPADLILLYADQAAFAGVLIFLCVQACYFMRIRASWKNSPGYFGIRIELLAGFGAAALFAVMLFLISILNIPFEALTVLAALYISVFFVNCVCGISEAFWLRRETAVLFVAGLILFFCCDINVGLNFLNGSLQEGSWIAEAAAHSNILMWLFYLPGQVLLVLSGVRRNKNER